MTKRLLTLATTLFLFLFFSSRAAVAQDAAAVLDAAAKAMGASMTSLQYSGTGSSYFYGQAPTPGGAWPRFVLKSYVTEIDYETASMRQDISRTNPDGSGAAHLIQYVRGTDAWDLTGTPPAPVPMFRETGSSTPAAQDRGLRIWMTPVGFIKAAVANHGVVRSHGAVTVISFTLPDHRTVTGSINAQHVVTRVASISDNPILGDTPIELNYGAYKDFGGVQFPTRIVQVQGGQEVLDLTVTDVKPGAPVAIDVPATVRGAKPPAVTVASTLLAPGTWFVKGASHNSVILEFKDHIVVVEGPVNEAQADAVIAEAHKLVPNKPIRFVVNTHHHFDHLGGVRAFAADGATIITTAAAAPYVEQALAGPHTLNPDKLSKAGRKAKVEGVNGKRVLTDGTRQLVLYVLPYQPHVDALLFPYLPAEKILIQADITVTPPASGAAGPVNPLSAKLGDDLRRLQLDVTQIVGIHGGVTPFAQLQALLGKPTN